MSETVKCYCGACTMTITGEPAMQLFCHCSDCRRWGGGTAQAAKLYPADNVKVEGALLARDAAFIGKPSNSWRHSCAKCGGVVYDNKSHMGMAMVPAGLSDKPFQPTIHVFYTEKIISVKDGLPKFKNLPKDFGGDSETMDE